MTSSVPPVRLLMSILTDDSAPPEVRSLFLVETMRWEIRE